MWPLSILPLSLCGVQTWVWPIAAVGSSAAANPRPLDLRCSDPDGEWRCTWLRGSSPSPLATVRAKKTTMSNTECEISDESEGVCDHPLIIGDVKYERIHRKTGRVCVSWENGWGVLEESGQKLLAMIDAISTGVVPTRCHLADDMAARLLRLRHLSPHAPTWLSVIPARCPPRADLRAEPAQHRCRPRPRYTPRATSARLHHPCSPLTCVSVRACGLWAVQAHAQGSAFWTCARRQVARPQPSPS